MQNQLTIHNKKSLNGTYREIHSPVNSIQIFSVLTRDAVLRINPGSGALYSQVEDEYVNWN